MKSKRRWLYLVIIFTVAFVATLLINYLLNFGKPSTESDQTTLGQPQGPTPPTFQQYTAPQLPDKPSYTILLIGDSMIGALGPQSDRFRQRIELEYPNKVFGIFNYGAPSHNIKFLNQALHTSVDTVSQQQPAILDRQFDILIIESFGYNPLSDYSISEGTTLQTQILQTAMSEITNTHPESLVIFLGTIAPDLKNYGVGVVDLSADSRRQWAEERRAYIENHLYFARQHNIPIIDAYHASMDEAGNTIEKYVDQGDHIHPSFEGVELMSTKIMEYLVNNKIIPK